MQAVGSGVKLGGVFNADCFSPVKDLKTLKTTFENDKLHISAFPTLRKVIEQFKGQIPRSQLVRSLQYDGIDLNQLPLTSLFLKTHLKWSDKNHNVVTNVGLQYILDDLFTSVDSSALDRVDPWYVALIATSTPTIDPTDIMSSHGGWTENVNYDEATRQSYVPVRSSQSVTNAASKASFTIDTDSQTIGGAFLTSGSAKSGTSGVLLCGEAFTGGDKSADDDDTLEVTYTFSASDN